MENIQTRNRQKYLKAPTIEEIDFVIKDTGMSAAQFERFFAMHKGVVKHVRAGYKQLPAKYWHIFFENLPSPTLGPPSRESNVLLEDSAVVEQRRIKKAAEDLYIRTKYPFLL